MTRKNLDAKRQPKKDGMERPQVVGGEPTERLSTGVAGLNQVLGGGLLPRRAYLVRGGPGTGKTCLGWHFLIAGRAAGQRCLYITMESCEENLRENAQSMGLSLEGIDVLDLSPTSETFSQLQVYDIFTPAEVEQVPITRLILKEVETLRPQRVFLEALTQFRYLSPDAFQFHKQVVSFLRYLTDQGVTVLFTSEGSRQVPDDDLQFLGDGVIHLEIGPHGRTLTVDKFRGSGFREGKHSLRLGHRGMHVAPRLAPEAHGRPFSVQFSSSGIPELDEMLQGGILRSMATIITGPSGVGKTTLCMQFMKEAAGRGEHSVVYLFEEWQESLIRRCEAVNIPVRKMLDQGTLSIIQINPSHYTADEFAELVRQEVEHCDARTVMIDSISGYQLCIRGEGLVCELHALTKYLRTMGVTCLLVNEVETVTGEFRATELGISFLVDNIIFLRYLEMNGELRKMLGVLKTRMSEFQPTLRELQITRFGIKVGPPLTGVRGILSGAPEMSG